MFLITPEHSVKAAISKPKRNTTCRLKHTFRKPWIHHTHIVLVFRTHVLAPSGSQNVLSLQRIQIGAKHTLLYASKTPTFSSRTATAYLWTTKPTYRNLVSMIDNQTHPQVVVWRSQVVKSHLGDRAHISASHRNVKVVGLGKPQPHPRSHNHNNFMFGWAMALWSPSFYPYHR
jgi:hypothetical protein